MRMHAATACAAKSIKRRDTRLDCLKQACLAGGRVVSRSSVVRGGRRLFMYTLRAACGDFCLLSVGCILPKEEEEEALITRPPD